MDTLVQCIRDQYQRDRSSRILIFHESRKGCSNLASFLTKNPVIAQTFGPSAVSHLVSVNQANSKYGQTFGTQKEILRIFRQGHIKILVATAVAEEGLDVATCNLVIKYNSVGSEKTFIQRKGRARAKNSRSILLAHSDSVEQQEFRNIIREYRMKMCIDALQELDEEDLKNKVCFTFFQEVFLQSYFQIEEKKSELFTLLAEEERRLDELKIQAVDK